MAAPQHFFGPLDVTGNACRHEPQLCGILATECTGDKIVSGFRIETILKLVQASEVRLLP